MKYSKEFEAWYAKKRPIWCDEYCASEGKKLMWAAWNAGKANKEVSGGGSTSAELAGYQED